MIITEKMLGELEKLVGACGSDISADPDLLWLNIFIQEES